MNLSRGLLAVTLHHVARAGHVTLLFLSKPGSDHFISAFGLDGSGADFGVIPVHETWPRGKSIS